MTTVLPIVSLFSLTANSALPANESLINHLNGSGECAAVFIACQFSALGSARALVDPLAMVALPYDLQAWFGALYKTAISGERRAQQARAASVWERMFACLESLNKHLTAYCTVKRGNR